jgi:hypothetical protein
LALQVNKKIIITPIWIQIYCVQITTSLLTLWIFLILRMWLINLPG